VSRHSAGAEPPGDPVLLAGREPLPELLEELGLARETELAGQLARSRGYELGERLVGDVEGPAVQRGGGGREPIGVASPYRRSSATGDAHLTDSRPTPDQRTRRHPSPEQAHAANLAVAGSAVFRSRATGSSSRSESERGGHDARQQKPEDRTQACRPKEERAETPCTRQPLSRHEARASAWLRETMLGLAIGDCVTERPDGIHPGPSVSRGPRRQTNASSVHG
jgi:hypothetical protein